MFSQRLERRAIADGFRDVLRSEIFRSVKIRDRSREAKHTNVRSCAETEACYGPPQKPVRLTRQGAVLVDLLAFQLCVAETCRPIGQPAPLRLPRIANARTHLRRRLALRP